MNELEDAVHWSSDPDAPEGMRELLRAAAADPGPTAAELASLRGRMAPQLAPAAGAGLLSARRLVIGLLVVGVGVGLVIYFGARSDRPVRAVDVAAPSAAPIVVPVAPATPPSPPPPPAPVVTTEPPPPAPSPHRAQKKVPAPVPPAVEPAPTPPVPTPQISEVALLEQARAAVRGNNPTQALALTEQHATLYPDGVLVEEREALAIEALMKLGRSDEAHTRWSKFATAYPHSNYHARLQRLMK